VLALLASILVFFLFPLIFYFKNNRIKFIIADKALLWLFLNNIILLTWIGANPVEPPFIQVGQLRSILYFLLIYIIVINHKTQKRILK
jgi:ubiquinol-cytochrome c reductase cytochrome b subunit